MNVSIQYSLVGPNKLTLVSGLHLLRTLPLRQSAHPQNTLECPLVDGMHSDSSFGELRVIGQISRSLHSVWDCAKNYRHCRTNCLGAEFRSMEDRHSGNGRIECIHRSIQDPHCLRKKSNNRRCRPKIRGQLLWRYRMMIVSANAD